VGAAVLGGAAGGRSGVAAAVDASCVRLTVAGRARGGLRGVAADEALLGRHDGDRGAARTSCRRPCSATTRAGGAAAARA